MIMKSNDYKVLLELVRKYDVDTILRFVADAWSDVWHEKYEIKSIGAKMDNSQERNNKE